MLSYNEPNSIEKTRRDFVCLFVFNFAPIKKFAEKYKIGILATISTSKVIVNSCCCCCMVVFSVYQ